MTPEELAAQEAAAQAEQAAEEAAATQPTDPPAKTDPWDGIPEEWSWTKNAVESANREAAARRVALNELKEQTKDAKTPEEYTAAMAEFTSKQTALEAELARTRAARKHNLADDVLEFLTGTTEEQIEAQAAKLASLKPASQGAPLVVTALTPTGGADPSQTPKADSGREQWENYKARTRR